MTGCAGDYIARRNCRFFQEPDGCDRVRALHILRESEAEARDLIAFMDCGLSVV